MTQRWVIDRHGRDGLRLDEMPTPEPRPGEVRVAVSAVALDARVGAGVSRFRPGDRVIANFMPEWIDGRPGGSAERPSYRASRRPLSRRPGAAPLRARGVAGRGTRHAERCRGGAPARRGPDRLIRTDGAGPCASGTDSVDPRRRRGRAVRHQIAAAHGAEVIITSSCDQKLERAKALGARHGINRNTADRVAEIHRVTGGRGVDHVLDLVGGGNFARSIAAVAPGGRVSVIGLLGGIELRAPTTPVLLKAPVIQGIVTGHRRALEDLVRAIDRIELKPVIDRRYPFQALPEALDHLACGAFGKIVVEMATAGDEP